MSGDDDIKKDDSETESALEESSVRGDADGFTLSADALRRAIRAGHYRVDPDRLARVMLHHAERPLKPQD